MSQIMRFFEWLVTVPNPSASRPCDGSECPLVVFLAFIIMVIMLPMMIVGMLF